MTWHLHICLSISWHFLGICTVFIFTVRFPDVIKSVYIFLAKSASLAAICDTNEIHSVALWGELFFQCPRVTCYVQVSLNCNKISIFKRKILQSCHITEKAPWEAVAVCKSGFKAITLNLQYCMQKDIQFYWIHTIYIFSKK